MKTFDMLAFDADDTLWHSEDGFHASEQRFVELPFRAEGSRLHVQAPTRADT